MIPVNAISQLCANAIVTGSAIALVGLGFGLVYYVGRFFNFAHGIFFTAGAYVAYFYGSHTGFGLIPSVILATCSVTTLGFSIEVLVYRPLRQKRASSLVILLASLGIYVLLQNFVSIGFGDDLKTLRQGTISEGLILFGARVTSVQIFMVVICAVLVSGLAFALRWTKLGRAMRAIGNDPELAMTCGIEIDTVMLYCMAMSAALAGIAGILVALDVGMVPSMGMEALMMAVVAIVVGGVGSIPGITAASLLLGFARHFGIWAIGSEWQDAVSFLILLLFLFLRPIGFFGKRRKKSAK